MIDVVAESVAAYSGHIAEYTEANAGLMQHERERFASSLYRHASVLDAGCGPGRDLGWFTAAGFDAVGVDLNPGFVEAAQKKGRATLANLTDLPFPAGVFAGVWACASLVHLPYLEAEKALSELRRVATSVAPLYASVKCDGGTGWRDTAHGRRWFKTWTAPEFARAVEDAGFTVASAEVNGAFIDVRAVAT